MYVISPGHSGTGIPGEQYGSHASIQTKFKASSRNFQTEQVIFQGPVMAWTLASSKALHKFCGQAECKTVNQTEQVFDLFTVWSDY